MGGGSYVDIRTVDMFFKQPRSQSQNDEQVKKKIICEVECVHNYTYTCLWQKDLF